MRVLYDCLQSAFVLWCQAPLRKILGGASYCHHLDTPPTAPSTWHGQTYCSVFNDVCMSDIGTAQYNELNICTDNLWDKASVDGWVSSNQHLHCDRVSGQLPQKMWSVGRQSLLRTSVKCFFHSLAGVNLTLQTSMLGEPYIITGLCRGTWNNYVPQQNGVFCELIYAWLYKIFVF